MRPGSCVRVTCPSLHLSLRVVVWVHLYVPDKNLYTATANISSFMNIYISVMGVSGPCPSSGQIVTSAWQLCLYLTIQIEFINPCCFCILYQWEFWHHCVFYHYHKKTCGFWWIANRPVRNWEDANIHIFYKWLKMRCFVLPTRWAAWQIHRCTSAQWKLFQAGPWSLSFRLHWIKPCGSSIFTQYCTYARKTVYLSQVSLRDLEHLFILRSNNLLPFRGDTLNFQCTSSSTSYILYVNCVRLNQNSCEKDMK